MNGIQILVPLNSYFERRIHSFYGCGGDLEHPVLMVFFVNSIIIQSKSKPIRFFFIFCIITWKCELFVFVSDTGTSFKASPMRQSGIQWNHRCLAHKYCFKGLTQFLTRILNNLRYIIHRDFRNLFHFMNCPVI